MAYRNILLIDDDLEDQEIFVSALRSISKEITCTVIGDPIKALARLSDRESTPDMIFLDLNMPLMSGQDFLKKIKELDFLREIPVIIFSTSSYAPTLDITKKLGASGFITKPGKFDELIQILKRLIN